MDSVSAQAPFIQFRVSCRFHGAVPLDVQCFAGMFFPPRVGDPTICSFPFHSRGGKQQYQTRALPALFQRFIFPAPDADLLSRRKGTPCSAQGSRRLLGQGPGTGRQRTPSRQQTLRWDPVSFHRDVIALSRQLVYRIRLTTQNLKRTHPFPRSGSNADS